MPLFLRKPARGPGVGLEELKKQICHLLAAGLRWVDAIFTEVLSLPHEAITLAGLHPIGPEVGPPKENRGANRTLHRIIVQLGLTLDLLLDQPPNGERALI